MYNTQFSNWQVAETVSIFETPLGDIIDIQTFNSQSTGLDPLKPIDTEQHDSTKI